MSRDAVIVFLVAALVAAAALAWRRWERGKVTVWEWQAGLLFRDGRFVRALPAGRHARGRGDHVATVSLNARTDVVARQEALTRDGFAVRLSAVLYWRVTDARRYHAANDGSDPLLPTSLLVATQLALRQVVGESDLDGLLAPNVEGTPMDAARRAPVAEALAAIGAELESITLRDLHLPAELRRMVTEAERARREGLAALERARGELAALRSLANAARMLRGNPELQALRTLQALTPAPGRAAPTLVLGAGALMPVGTREAAPETAADPDPEIA